MRLAQVSTEQYLGATGRLLWGVRVHGVRAGDAGGSVERYKSSQGAGSGQGAPTGVRAGVGEESRRTTWNGGGGGGNDWVRAWVRVGESPKGSGPEEKEEGKLQCTYCLCPASIRSPQAPEKVSQFLVSLGAWTLGLRCGGVPAIVTLGDLPHVDIYRHGLGLV